MDINYIDNIMASAFEREVYRVGGSVRDELIGRQPKDADYVVRERPLKEVRATLEAAGAHTGQLKLRTGHVIGIRAAFRGVGVAEVALPRKEVSTGPGRHDFDIVVDPNITLSEDCCRRDFTFNALYKDLCAVSGEDFEVIDPTGRGLFDLERRLITTTHSDSFRDDPLRMLRALRFVACLGFDFSLSAIEQMETHVEAITGLNSNGNMSGTVWGEVQKLVMGDRAANAVFMGQGVLEKLFIGFRCRIDQLDTAIKLNAPLRVRLALLFKDGGWQAAGTMTNMPKDVKSSVAKLIENPVPLEGGSVPKRARFMRVEFGDDLSKDMILMAACVAAHGKNKQNHLGVLGSLEKAREAAQTQCVPASIKELSINGRDMIELGIEPQNIGNFLRAVLHYVNRNPAPSNMALEAQRALVERWTSG